MNGQVTVIGAGVAGLVAARDLALAGCSVRVLEAQEAPGGMIAPASLGGVTIDIGAEAFAVRDGVVPEYVRELGLGDEIVQPRQLGSWGYQDGEAYPMPAGGLLGIPPGPDAPGLLAAIGELGVADVQRESTLPGKVGADCANLADFVRARYGERVLQRLVAPVARGVYSLDPEHLSVDRLLPGVREQLLELGSVGAVIRQRRPGATPGALVHGVRGGMHRFVAALVADCQRLGVAFHYGVRVGSLAEFAGPVIVTVPPSDTFPYLGELRAAEPVPTEVVALLVTAPSLNDFPRGTGVLVAGRTGAPGCGRVQAKALTHVTAKWEWPGQALPAGQHILRLSYPPAAIGATPEQHLADASAILGVQLTGSDLIDSARHVWQMPAPPASAISAAADTGTDRSGNALQETAVVDLVEGGASERASGAGPRVALTGTWIAGTGLANVIPHARRAARKSIMSA